MILDLWHGYAGYLGLAILFAGSIILFFISKR